MQVKLHPLFPNDNKIVWWLLRPLPLPGQKMLTDSAVGVLFLSDPWVPM